MKNVGKLAVLLLFSRFSASFFFTFCSSQVPKVEENELFCCYFQTFALVFPNFEKKTDIFQKFFRNFWKKSEIFLKNFWKFLNLEIFCCQPMKNVGKLAVCCCFRGFQLVVSLLFAVPRYQKWRKTNCFAAIFKLLRWFSPVLKNFSNFEKFQTFFRKFSDFFSENFQKFLKKIWKFSWKFLKISESRNFLLPANEKCRKTSCLLLFSRFSASCFFTFCSSQAPKRTVLLLISTFALVFSNFEKFQSFFRKFSEIFQKIFRNFWKKSENFLKNLWKFLNLEIFCCQPMKNVGKLAVCCCFRGFQLVVSLLFAVPRYQKWRKTNCFAAIFKLLRWFSPILKKNRHFSENFQKFLKKIWKISENFWI